MTYTSQTCGEFTLQLPVGWSIYKDLRHSNGVHLVKMEDSKHCELFVYVYAKNQGVSATELIEFYYGEFSRGFPTEGQLSPEPVSETEMFGRRVSAKPFIAEIKNSRSPHELYTMSLDLPSYDALALVQFPVHQRTKAIREATEVLNSIKELVPDTNRDSRSKN